ncbi:MAG: RloB family protein [Rickettsiales bacterium]|jgi:hypothetical protein|nr:RloB family protein [Rickettsiales bacterium]
MPHLPIINFTRPEKTSKAKPLVLILTEGKETEPLYFRAMCDDFGIKVVNINSDDSEGVAIQHDGPAPQTIAERAERELSNYDEIYCVFDKDKHTGFDLAINNIKNIDSKSTSVKAIYSVISFETWFLMHFNNSAKPYDKSDELIKELKKVNSSIFGSYTKSSRGIYDRIKEHTDTAIKNSKIINKAAELSGTDNPKTFVYLLVERLREISKL